MSQTEWISLICANFLPNSLGNNMEIGEAIRVRFIWDHGGTIVYVCVMQNGIKKSYRLLKEVEGYHSANATLWAGRCEFRYVNFIS